MFLFSVIDLNFQIESLFVTYFFFWHFKEFLFLHLNNVTNTVAKQILTLFYIQRNSVKNWLKLNILFEEILTRKYNQNNVRKNKANLIIFNLNWTKPEVSKVIERYYE